jgi:hypothetical protein
VGVTLKLVEANGSAAALRRRFMIYLHDQIIFAFAFLIRPFILLDKRFGTVLSGECIFSINASSEAPGEAARLLLCNPA